MSKRFLLDTYIIDTANKYNVTVEQLEGSLDTLLTITTFDEEEGFIILFEKVKTILTALGLIATLYNIHGEKAAYVLNYFYNFIPNNINDNVLIHCIRKQVYEKEMQRAIVWANNKMYEYD